MNATSAIVLFAHGARDPEWAEPFVKMQRMLAAREPGVRVELAFLELMQPSLFDTIARLAADGIQHITLVPLFMAQGGHLKHDLPLMLDDIRQQYPALALRLAPAVGDVEAILEAIVAWIGNEHRSR